MIYSFDDFELDTSTYELRRSGEPVHLEPQVYGVLAHLIEHRDRVVSKIELLDEVWPDRFVSESALTSRVRAARAAVGDTGRDQRIIRTKHGRGYRFVATVAVRTEGSEVSSVPPPAAPMGGSTDTIGRDDELRQLDAIAERAISGTGALVFVEGDAGMGKTTFIEALDERTDLAGVRVVRARCRAHRERPEPYVSLLDALSRFGREHGAFVVDLLERAAPMWLMQLPSLVDPERVALLERKVLGGTRERMLREGVDLIDQLAADGPLVLVVEDAHWADPPTLELLRWLSGRVDQCPLLVLVTYRPGADRTGELEATVAEAITSRVGHRIALGPLDDQVVAKIVADRLDATDLHPALVTMLAARSGGNPLFAVEQAECWLRNGQINVVEGHAEPAVDPAELDRAVPDGLRQLIDGSISGLAPLDVEILEAGAVVGREFPAFAVAAAVGRSIPEVEDRLGGLARTGSWVTATGDEAWGDGTVCTVFRLTHDHHHRVLYDRISTSRRATIHHRVGARLEEAYGTLIDEHSATLLRHFEASHDHERAMRYLQRMGELSLARGAHAEALDPLETALGLVAAMPPGDDRDQREVGVRTALGSALVATLGWRRPEVQDNYERALELAVRLGADPERFVLRYGLAVVHELRGEFNRCEVLLREQLADGNELGLETRELLACSMFHQGGFVTAREFADAGIDMWDAETHSVYMARYGEHPGVGCSTWAALAAWFLGEPEESLALAEQAVAWGADNEYALTTASVQFAFLHQFRGEPDHCRFWAEATVRLADRQGFPYRSALGEALMGWCDAVEGDPQRGCSRMLEGLAGYHETGACMDSPYFLGLLAEVKLNSGLANEALEHLDEADELVAETTRSHYFQSELDRLRAAALVATGGAESDAAQHLRAAAAQAEAHGSPILAMRVAVTALRLGLGDVGETSARLAALVDRFGDHRDLPDVRRAQETLAAR